MEITVILLVFIAIIAGCFFGTMTGLIPGLHVNNVAIILLSIAIALKEAIPASGPVDQSSVFLVIAAAIVATSITHTFLDFIPSTFLGAPDPALTLSVLPAHEMLLKGNGYKAVMLSAIGSFGAICTACVLIIPFRFVVLEPLNGYVLLKANIVYVLLGVIFLMLITETRKVEYVKKEGKRVEGFFSRPLGVLLGICVFTLTGVFGLAVLNMNAWSPFGLEPVLLFPALSGIFGTSALLDSLRQKPGFAPQNLNEPHPPAFKSLKSIFFGTLGGACVGFLPGMSGGVATVITQTIRGEKEQEQVIVTLSAINTANSFFVLVALFLILRPRSGAAIVVDRMVDVTAWNGVLPPAELTILLLSALLAGCLSLLILKRVGRIAAKLFHKVPYRKTVAVIIILIVAMVFVFTGPVGLLVLLVATAIGLLPVWFGVRRSHAMGVLLLPVVVMLW